MTNDENYQDYLRCRIGSNDSYLSNRSVSCASDGNLADDENILSDTPSLTENVEGQDNSHQNLSHEESVKKTCVISSRARHLQIDSVDDTDDDHHHEQKQQEVITSIKECIHKIVVMCLEHHETSQWLSNLAVNKYERFGKGSLLLVLPSLEIAKEFCIDDFKKLLYNPSYVDKETLLKSASNGSSKASNLVSMCDLYNPLEEYLLCVTVIAPLQKRQDNYLRIISGNAHSKTYKACVRLPLCPILSSPSATLDSPPLVNDGKNNIPMHDHLVVSHYDFNRNDEVTTTLGSQFLQDILDVLASRRIKCKDNYPGIYSKLEDCIQTGAATQPITFTAINECNEHILCTIILELPVHV